MSALRGFIAGTIAVSTVEVLVSYQPQSGQPGVADRLGSAGDLLAQVIARVVDPDVPAVGKADFVKPAPVVFGQATPSQPDRAGGSGRPRSKQLHSTKAKPPRSVRAHELRGGS